MFKNFLGIICLGVGVLSLGIAQGMTIKLIADGSDESEALDGLESLVNTGFAE